MPPLIWRVQFIIIISIIVIIIYTYMNIYELNSLIYLKHVPNQFLDLLPDSRQCTFVSPTEPASIRGESF